MVTELQDETNIKSPKLYLLTVLNLLYDVPVSPHSTHSTCSPTRHQFSQQLLCRQQSLAVVLYKQPWAWLTHGKRHALAAQLAMLYDDSTHNLLLFIQQLSITPFIATSHAGEEFHSTTAERIGWNSPAAQLCPMTGYKSVSNTTSAKERGYVFRSVCLSYSFTLLKPLHVMVAGTLVGSSGTLC